MRIDIALKQKSKQITRQRRLTEEQDVFSGAPSLFQKTFHFHKVNKRTKIYLKLKGRT